MKILAVDTALGACSVAVLDGRSILANRFELMERGHAERLAPMVRETMQEAVLAFDGLDRLAVTIGPGTFTGQRVGYAFMRGLRLALQRPLVGITTLAAMARAAMAQTGALGAAVLHDARRGEVYVTAVAHGSTIVPVKLALFEDAVREVVERTQSFDMPFAFAGTASAAAAQICRTLGRTALETGINTPDALWVARLALAEAPPQTIPRPLYLRPPDARLPAAVA